MLCSDHVYDGLADEIELKQELVKDITAWLLLDAISLGEDAENTIQVFEFTQIDTRIWIIDHQKQAVNYQILSNYALLGQTDVEDGVHHDLHATDSSTHLWLPMAQCEYCFNGMLAQLLIFRVLGYTSQRLPQKIRKGRRVLLDPCLYQLEALQTLLDDLSMLIFTFQNEADKDLHFHVEQDLANLLGKLDQLLDNLY